MLAAICSSLLVVLNDARGSLAGIWNEEVTRLQRGGLAGSTGGVSCRVITTVGVPAFFGE
jgi:hypothetical protein